MMSIMWSSMDAGGGSSGSLLSSTIAGGWSRQRQVAQCQTVHIRVLIDMPVVVHVKVVDIVVVAQRLILHGPLFCCRDRYAQCFLCRRAESPQRSPLLRATGMNRSRQCRKRSGSAASAVLLVVDVAVSMRRQAPVLPGGASDQSIDKVVDCDKSQVGHTVWRPPWLIGRGPG